MVAKSGGKDAADTLIILVLYEMARLGSRRKITLVTKDHFGKTLQAVLSGLGIKIETVSKWEGYGLNESNSYS